MPRVQIRQVSFVLAVMAFGAAIAIIMPHFLSLAPDNNSPPSPPRQCDDKALKATTIDTTFSMGGDSEKPSFSSDTTFTVPIQWHGVADLLSSSADAKYRATVTCFLPDKSTAYRPNAPTVSVGDSEQAKNEQAKKKKKEFVGDLITLRDYAQSNDNDSSFLPDDLGVWYLGYRGSPTRAWCDNQPKHFPHSYILAVLCPDPGSGRSGEWTIHLNLQGSSIAASSHRPVQYSEGTSATWKVADFGTTRGSDLRGFWVELKPDRGPGLYLTMREWHGGIVPVVSAMIGWTIFFLLLLISARRIPSAAGYPHENRGWDAAESLQGICICALLACALITATDAIWSVSSDRSSHAVYFRLEAILVFSLVSIVGLHAWRGPRRKFLIVLAVLALGVLGYFGPQIIAIESGQALLPSTETLNYWRLTGYFDHLLIGVALVAVLVAGVLAVGKAAAETIIPATEWTRTDSSSHGPGRLARYVIALVCGMAAVLQWVRIAYDQWDHRRLFPGAPASLGSISRDILPRFPWFPDFILHWLPTILFYPAIICIFATLARLAMADTSQGWPVIRSAPPAFSLTKLLFAVGVVGIFGSYRSIQLPIAFLVSLILMDVMVRPAKRLDEEIQRAKKEMNKDDLEQLQQALLKNSREQSLQQTLLKNSREQSKAGRKRQDAAADEDSISSYSRQEIALALGPRIGWWENALYATKISALVAIPIVAYDAYQSFRSGIYSSYLNSFGGFFSLLQWVLSEILIWIAAGFTLGALWPLIPGRRGVYKGLALSAVAIASTGTDVLISRMFGQSTWDLATCSTVTVFRSVIALPLSVA